ncbi:hypothetical protein AG0111_0g7559 [Alternaria gaisen]|uniref:Uncharacterized protein n=1 Tax=Alternaria gaisen TaxID=167740 RepID=A0ACB6FIT2_9PLEO|nr:hypothetical protein AG0111_0g7559 [Alternaria gaisen]
MANNEASEYDDREAKMTTFNAMKKTDMKAFLVALNESIPSFRDKVRLTGNISDLKDRYRSYLFPETQSILAAQSKKTTKPPAKRTKTSHDEGVEEDESDDNKAATPSMLDQLLIPEPVHLSKSMIDCLRLLNSPLSTTAFQKAENEDLSEKLGLLYQHTSTIIRVKDSITVSWNHATNYERLSAGIRKEPVAAPAMFVPFLTGMGFQLTENNSAEEDEEDMLFDQDIGLTGDHAEQDDASAMSEIKILWNEANRAFERWSSTFPAPPVEHISYPRDFSEKEKKKVRNHARAFIDKRSHLANKATPLEDLDEAYEQLMEEWPIEKGKILAIVQTVFQEAKLNFGRSKSRSQSSSFAGSATPSERGRSRSVGGGKNDALGGEEDAGEEKKNLRRKRRIVESDDDEEEEDDDDEGEEEFERGEYAPRGRSRASRPATAAIFSRQTRARARAAKNKATRYPSPAKKGAKGPDGRSLLAVEEEDEDEDEDENSLFVKE